MNKRSRTPTLALERAEQVAAMGSPLRREMLEALGWGGPASVAELAKVLNASPTKLHYHAKVLLQAQLIVPVHVRAVRSRQETVYDRVADEFMVSPIGKPPAYVHALKQVASAMQSMALKEHDAALDLGLINPANTWIWRGTASLSPDHLKEARRLLGELRALFEGARWANAGQAISLTVFLTPSVRKRASKVLENRDP